MYTGELEKTKLVVIYPVMKYFKWVFLSVVNNLFLFQKLHLPPELSESASRSQEDIVTQNKSNRTLCSSSATSKLDF